MQVGKLAISSNVQTEMEKRRRRSAWGTGSKEKRGKRKTAVESLKRRAARRSWGAMRWASRKPSSVEEKTRKKGSSL